MYSLKFMPLPSGCVSGVKIHCIDRSRIGFPLCPKKLMDGKCSRYKRLSPTTIMKIPALRRISQKSKCKQLQPRGQLCPLAALINSVKYEKSLFFGVISGTKRFQAEVSYFGWLSNLVHFCGIKNGQGCPFRYLAGCVTCCFTRSRASGTVFAIEI